MSERPDQPHERAAMAERLRKQGIVDERVLNAMRSVPRHEFVPESEQEGAYNEGPLPIGDGQTISAPWIVAFSVQELQLPEQARVLEVGTGSGYGAAVLAAA